MIMGQSNIAAGATIGSNHNSRGADGEIIAGRGFWPGLCVSLKHNSKFASFTIISKGDYPSELNIPVPFSLIINDVSKDRLVVLPAYWFMYNYYALARNAWKYQDRDRRTGKLQKIEYNYLAPDTVNEIFDSLLLLEKLEINKEGDAVVKGWENSNRQTLITKVPKAVEVFKTMIRYYGITILTEYLKEGNFKDFTAFKNSLRALTARSVWKNTGGQLIKSTEISELKKKLRSGEIESWDEVHNFYRMQGENYKQDKADHAYTSLLELLNISPAQFTPAVFSNLLDEMVNTKTWISKGIYDSRAKDYSNPFRKMVYESEAEMEKVIGKLDDNSFLQIQFKELEEMKVFVTSAKRLFEQQSLAQ